MAKVLNLKSLTFVRHAYAVSAADFYGSDHDRPLSPKGVEAAKLLARELSASVPPPDVVLVSDAVRALETLKHLKDLIGEETEVKEIKELYDCSAGQLYNIILENQKERGHMLIVGHNPAVSQLYSMLSGEYTALAPAQSRTLILEES
ncbi:histidine phosphatase family protein [bacterium]|nr:histidine phosphatase family protein [bacterium]